MASSSADTNIPFATNRLSGTKLTYDPSWTGPLNAKRKITNIPFIIAFFLLVGAWIGLSAYIFSSADVDAVVIFQYGKKLFAEQKWTLLGLTVLSYFLSILFLVLLRVAAKTVTYISTYLIIIVWGLSTISFIVAAISENSTKSIILTLLMIMALILIIRIHIRNSKLIPVSCEIIREACKIILSFPSIIFYAFVHFILFYILCNWCLIVTELIVYLDDFEDDYPAYVYVCCIVNGFAGIWISVYIFEIFRVTVAGTYGTWYWTENKREVPRFTALRFIYIPIRYHIGPVAFGSLIMPFCCIPRFFVWLIASGLGIDCSSSGNRVARLFQRCFNCCHGACYGVVKKFTGMSFVHVALHGNTGFVDASRASSGLCQKNFTKVAVLGQIVLILYLAGMLTVMFLSSIFLFLPFIDEEDEEDSEIMMAISIQAIIMISFVIFKLLGIAVDTILMCVLEDFEMNGGSSSYMSDNLKNLLL